MPVIPTSAQPYAKALVAIVIVLVGVAVNLLWISSALGAQISAAVTAVAAILGVVVTPAPGYVGPPARSARRRR